ncbi:sugar phosphate isomerase/epimerase [Telmatocola sphagniphila]|uniref:Sugar phosphate isomerase/epimerase n=1 Tax=Telmatocola sphagniphila TaxID=1123043 RepID=A0A8E6EU50_9BACT|nr:sugar phosphate isomerase/epimerase [Telmatocola sphagniphila]QVL33274.1 sugar phosphate isomerase/epimerase [Telmatocola sphagniphila]
MNTINRRQALTAAAIPIFASSVQAKVTDKKSTFGFCLNTSTIRGQKLPVEEEAKLAAKAGYNGFEPWIFELDAYSRSGKSLKDLGKLFADLGLQVPSAIGFAKWIAEDEKVRKAGLEEAKRDMDKLQQIGGQRMAAPPIGATDVSGMDMLKIAERFRVLVELGEQMGIIPECEHWGHSKTLSRLGEVTLVAMESKRPKAVLLPDIFHLFKGGSDFEGLKMLRGESIGIFHMNDYPKDLPRERIKDADRIFPGDGIAPLNTVLKTLHQIGYQGFLSLELFNPEYYKRDAFQVIKTGLEKMKEQVAKSEVS